ncbi:alpha/beta fold hydrolase [Streptomyces sp. NBC_01497]|uniref:alpha/beta fold hydrolase n=1 Tax=Streptomyces sp. NBC_01497 TaxID=2903885 RepID=UPI002E36CA00|nr:alpha/beta hydrolase [Streptomyces sp. NBC_01497]
MNSPHPPVPTRTFDAVSADGSRVHVEVHGADGAPAVVLSHGWTCNIAFWSEQIADLRGDHRVIAYDQRGHGASPAAAPDGYSTEALADDLEAVLDAALEPGEQAVLAGHSMGGMTMMAASARPAFREHAGAVLLCSTGASGLVPESRVVPMRAGRLRTGITRRILGARAPLGPVTPLSLRALRYGTMGPATPKDRVRRCVEIVHACPRGARVAWSAVLDTLDLELGVRELTVPTAVVAGDADRLTPPVHARRLAAWLPDCVGLTTLPGIGHMSPVEAPEAVTAAIRELAAAHLKNTEPAA